MAGGRLRILYVCDFSSIHARTLISHFAADPAAWEVVVASTAPAAAMDNVQLVPLASGEGGRVVRTGRLGALAYRASLALPSLFTHLRGREMLRQGEQQGAQLVQAVNGTKPDVVHVLRTQPEGLVALPFLRATDVPMLLSTWGQDLVLWARSGRAMRQATREVVTRAAHTFPDNERDSRLLVTHYGHAAGCTVMPVTGGLVSGPLEEADARPLPQVRGAPSLLSMRGWENAYIRVRVLLEALRLFIRQHPDAHLYLNGPAAHPGRTFVERWIRRYGVADHVSLVQLPRPALLDHMRAIDLNVSATLSDGLPISLLEALWLGQVPVVSNLESIRPPLVPGRNGIVFDRLDADAIAAAWEQARPLIPGREERRLENRRLIAAAFDRATNLERIAAAYHRCAA